MPVDAEGLDVRFAVAEGDDARFAYVTPACQFPTCAAMSGERRDQLLHWARRRGAVIIEDDWDHDARFDGGRSEPPLAQSDRERVLFVHTFNRLLFPALRIAALVVPQAMVGRFVEARWLIDGYTNIANQIVLTQFMQQVRRLADEAAQRLDFQSRHDQLTSLPNRYEFERAVQRVAVRRHVPTHAMSCLGSKGGFRHVQQRRQVEQAALLTPLRDDDTHAPVGLRRQPALQQLDALGVAAHLMV